MKKNNIILTLMIFILPCIFSQQNEKYTLSVDEAVNLALVNNLDLKSAQLNLDQKKWALATFWNKFIPSVSMTGALTVINKEIIDGAKLDVLDSVIDGYKARNITLSKSEAMDTDEYKENVDQIPKGRVSASLNVSFTLTGRMIFNVVGTVIDFQNGLITNKIAKSKVIIGVKKSYYSLNVLNEQVKLMEENLNSAKKRFEVADKKFKAELISELDKLNAEYTYEDWKVKLIDYQNKYLDLLGEFKQLLGIKNNIEVELSSNIEIPQNYTFNSEELISKYIDNNLDIKSQKKTYYNILNERNIYISSLMPTISFSYLADPSYLKPDPFGKDREWFRDINNEWRQSQGSFTFAISVPLDPWAPFSSTQLGIMITDYEMKKQRLLIEKTKEEKAYKIRSIIRNLDKINKTFNSFKIKVEMANKAYILSDHSYEAGLKLYIEVLDAQENANEARLELLNTQYEYYSNLLDLAYNLNLSEEELLK